MSACLVAVLVLGSLCWLIVWVVARYGSCQRRARQRPRRRVPPRFDDDWRWPR